MVRLQLIEKSITALNGSNFQNLCDAYMKLKHDDLISFNRTGSQIGKQKTIPGTPDTTIRLQDGNLWLVEFTTQHDGLVKKLKEDIDKCLNEELTEISAKEINEIILFHNSRLEPKDEISLYQYAREKLVKAQIIGLDDLAIDINSKYHTLAKDFLGIAYDTGQILTLDVFVEEYNRKGGNLSTPLDNEFLHRADELSEIAQQLSLNDIVIITGEAGVGKTKIALQVISNYLLCNEEFKAYIISQKDADIFDDLQIRLNNDGSYILLIDDANRQMANFKPIIGLYKGKKNGKLKLVITVRDYAKDEVTNQCSEISYATKVINKFTDEEIIKIIESPSFGIDISKYQKKILEISNGNARLAVMAVRLAIKEQWRFIERDLFDLYDSYFKTFIRDIDLFKDEGIIKTLGLISFFYSINKDNKAFIIELLTDFNIEYYEFMESVNELEKRELIECKYNVIRVSEQVMATYFFYRTFLAEDLLSFKTLLDKYYYNQWNSRFTECVISANNLFYYTNKSVLDKLSIVLGEYYDSIAGDKEKVNSFFSLFWVYKMEEFLAYHYSIIKAMPEPINPTYITHYEMNDFVWDGDEILSHLKKLFNQPSDNFLPALELAFEFCRKNPGSLPELIKIIRENLIFDEDDYKTGFFRQTSLFSLLISKSKLEIQHYGAAFFAIAKTFLSHTFNITKSGRRNIIVFSKFKLPNNDRILSLRKSIWEAICELYDKYQEETFRIIKECNPGMDGPVKEISDFDFSIVWPFLRARLERGNFEHVHFLQNPYSWINYKGNSNSEFQNYKAEFINAEYTLYRKMDMSYHLGKQDFEFDNNEEFMLLKERDIRQNIIFKSEAEFAVFHRAIENVQKFGKNSVWSVLRAVDIILDENFKQNNELGFELLKSIFKNYPTGLTPTIVSIRTILNTSNDWAEELWQLINNWSNDYSLIWKFYLFDLLPDNCINQNFYERLIETLKGINQGCHLDLKPFERFKAHEKDIIVKALSIIVSINEASEFKITLPFRFFEEYSNTLKNNFELLAKAYFQHEDLKGEHDYDRQGLKALMDINPEFLIDYLERYYSGKKSTHKDKHNRLSIIWDYDNEELIEAAFNTVIESKSYYSGVGEHELKVFFYVLKDSQKEKAQNFLLKYISRYNTDRQKINAIFDVIRHSLKEFFNIAFHHFLCQNTDPEFFKKIYWRGNGGTIMSTETNFGDLEAKDWENILEQIEAAPEKLSVIGIKAYVKRQISNSYRNAESERKMRFNDPHW